MIEYHHLSDSIMKRRPYRATKLEILEFFYLKRMVFIYLLIDEFGYSYKYAQVRLNRLKKQGLVTNPHLAVVCRTSHACSCRLVAKAYLRGAG